MFNRNLSFIALAFIGFLSACSSSKTASYTPISNNTSHLIIDGILEDNQVLQKSKLSGVDYSINTSNEYLYVGIKIANTSIQDNALRFGMGVWVDTTSKQKNLMGIQYPLKLSEEEQEIIAKQAQKISLEKAYIDLATEFEMVGFAPEPLKATNTSSQHFKAAVGFNELGNMICEYQIPWKAIYQSRSMNASENIAIKIQINDRPIIENDNQPDANNPLGTSITQGQNNGMYGNNMGNRNPYGNPMSGMRQTPQMNTKTQDYSAWIKLQVNQ